MPTPFFSPAPAAQKTPRVEMAPSESGNHQLYQKLKGIRDNKETDLDDKLEQLVKLKLDVFNLLEANTKLQRRNGQAPPSVRNLLEPIPRNEELTLAKLQRDINKAIQEIIEEIKSTPSSSPETPSVL